MMVLNLEDKKAEFDKLMGVEYTGVKGQSAINKLLSEEQGHVKDAFYRDDVGFIDVFYGDKTAGLHHIVAERNKRGTSGQKFAGELGAVIEKGVAFAGKNDQRMNIVYKGKIAVVAFELRGTETSALLTAFYTKNKDRSPGEG